MENIDIRENIIFLKPHRGQERRKDMNIEFNQYVAEVTEAVKAAEPSAEVDVREVTKMNGQVKTGLSIYKGQNMASPCIYLDYLFERGDSVQEAVDFILQANERECSFRLEDILNAEYVQGNVFFRMCNSEKNAGMLEGVPTYTVEGVDGIVYYPVLSVYAPEMGQGTIKVSREMLQNIGISEEEMFTAAQRNTEGMVKVSPIGQVLENLIPAEILEDADSPLMVIMGQEHQQDPSLFGAPGIWKNLNRELYVIPSSVHELLAIPAEFVEDEEYLISMIQDVNSNVLDPADFLSGNLYHLKDGQWNTITADSAQKDEIDNDSLTSYGNVAQVI